MYFSIFVLYLITYLFTPFYNFHPTSLVRFVGVCCIVVVSSHVSFSHKRVGTHLCERANLSFYHTFFTYNNKSKEFYDVN